VILFYLDNYRVKSLTDNTNTHIYRSHHAQMFLTYLYTCSSVYILLNICYIEKSHYKYMNYYMYFWFVVLFVVL